MAEKERAKHRDLGGEMSNRATELAEAHWSHYVSPLICNHLRGGI